MGRLFLTDKEVAIVAEISVATICRTFKYKNRYMNSPLLKAKPDKYGDTRRWNIHLLANALGVNEDEILSRLR